MKVALKHNQITDAARYAADNWGLDYLGSKLVGWFSPIGHGPLTASSIMSRWTAKPPGAP